MITLPFPFADVNNDSQRVANSVAALDAIFPNWPSKINLDTFNIHDSQMCVLSQITGGYSAALYEKRDVLGGSDLNQDHFTFWSGQNEWVKVITERQAQPDAPLTQYDQDWNLTITGPDFVTRGTPDWMVEVVGESLHKQINEIMEEARAKIAEVVGENYNVSLDHI